MFDYTQMSSSQISKTSELNENLSLLNYRLSMSGVILSTILVIIIIIVSLFRLFKRRSYS